MVYLLNMVIFYRYVSHYQRVVPNDFSFNKSGRNATHCWVQAAPIWPILSEPAGTGGLGVGVCPQIVFFPE